MSHHPKRRARAHHTHPKTSVIAAKKVTERPGGLKVTQQAVMVCMRMLGKAVLDEELIVFYNQRRKSMGLPEQSDSGIRSRRSELAQAGKLVQGGKKKMTTGGVGMTWMVPVEVTCDGTGTIPAAGFLAASPCPGCSRCA